MQAGEKAEEEKPESKEELEASSGNGINPASSVEGLSDSGLAKLDAGKEEDDTSVEDKIEAVAGALGTEDGQTDEPKVTSTPCIGLDYKAKVDADGKDFFMCDKRKATH